MWVQGERGFNAEDAEEAHSRVKRGESVARPPGRTRPSTTGGELASGGGGDGDAELLKLGARSALFLCAGVTLHHFAEFLDAGVFLAEFQQRHPFLIAGRSELEALGVVGKKLIVFDQRLLILVLRIGDFAEIKLGVGSEVCVAIVGQVVLKFRAREIEFAAVDVAQTVGVLGVR
jgi:hypothetical protein